MHQFLLYNEFIIHLYMLRAQLCPSSGGQNCITQHLTSSHSAGRIGALSWSVTKLINFVYVVLFFSFAQEHLILQITLYDIHTVSFRQNDFPKFAHLTRFS